jgi:nucleotidyltransferase substrate binding protein (TIGR01987 family)
MEFCTSDLAGSDAEIFLQFRSAAIQAFEYNYELAIKFLKRYLETTEASRETIDTLSFRDLVRLGAERGLIDDPTAWFGFRDKRNMTSHTYNSLPAEEIFRSLPDFCKKLDSFVEKLTQRV